jgi:hypothetical protein
MIEVAPKDLVIVDRGLSTEEPAYVYMAGTYAVAVCNLNGERYVAAKDRLTKCDAEGNPLT